MALTKNKISDLSPDQQFLNKYSLIDETFFHVADDSKINFLDVEIGDSKQPDFYPQIKIKRWDNEVNFSARLVNQEITPEIKIENDKIIWDGKKIACNFYNFYGEEGGYEFEVILKEKPITNKVEFTLQTKDLDFFYQPPLTKKEIDNGDFRPDYIIGSYAIYKTYTKLNYLGGKEYRFGKVGHIYRPKIIDADGAWCWGELNIDKDKGLLTITIPDKFLAKASYPVIVDPTFGYTTVGGSSTTFNTGRIWTNEYSTTEACYVHTIAVFGYNASADCRGVVYLSSNMSRITWGAQKDWNKDRRWHLHPVTRTLLTTSVAHRIGLWVGTSAPTIFYDTGQTVYYDTEAYHATNDPPATLADDGSTANRKLSMYAIYSPTTGSSITEVFEGFGSFSWVTPTGVSSVDVKCWGGGGSAEGNTYGGGGGGGGAYAASTSIAVTAGNSYAVVVGKGGDSDYGYDGEDSTFNATTVVAKKGVAGGVYSGAGGSAASSTGNTKYSGGNGGSRSTGYGSGGGGGAGGPHGNGASGSDGNSSTGGAGGKGDNNNGGAGGPAGNGANGGNGTSNANGGGGGGGGDTDYSGGMGGRPGGGGGGGDSNYGTTIAMGADGRVEITYTIVSSTTYVATIQAKARVKQINYAKSVQAKGRVANTGLIRTVQAKARLKLVSIADSIQAKGRVKQTPIKTIQAKASVKVFGQIKVSQAKGRIKQPNQAKVSQAKGRIKKTGSASIQAKAALLGAKDQTVQAKARIKQSGAITVQSKGRIEQARTQTTQSKARVRQLSLVDTSQAKAYIVSVGKVQLYSPADTSTQEIPLYFEWIIPSNRWGANINFHLQIDKTDDSFADLELEKRSWQDSGFEYYDGDSWEPVPITGITAAHVGRHCRYQATALIDGTKYWRVKAYAG